MLEHVEDLLERYQDERLFTLTASSLGRLFQGELAVYNLEGKQLWASHNDSPVLQPHVNGSHPLRKCFESSRADSKTTVEEIDEVFVVTAPVHILEGCIGYLALTPGGGAQQPGELKRIEPLLSMCGVFLGEALMGRRTGADLASELTARYEELSLVYTLTGALDMTRDQAHALRTIFEAVANTLNGDLLILVVPALNFESVYPEEGEGSMRWRTLGQTLYRRMHDAGKTIAINYVEEEGTLGEDAEAFSHIACVPLEVDGDPGMLALLRSGEEDRLYMGDVKMLEAVTKQISIFMTNRKIDAARRQLFDLTIFGLARLAESRDTETGEHLERVSSYCRILGEYLHRQQHYHDQMKRNFVETIFSTSPLHDIGKVGIPDAILNKPGKLSPEEFELMKQHAVIGGDTLTDIERHLNWGDSTFLTMGREIAYSHHEKWDGSGYPHQLSELGIPLAARIMAVADVYDALTSKRCYKDAFSHDKARDIIVEGRGRHFDPDLVECFLACEERFIEVRRQLQVRWPMNVPDLER